MAGTNRLEIEVTNTWFNRLAGDVGKPQDQRVTWAGAAGRGFGAGPAAAGSASAAARVVAGGPRRPGADRVRAEGLVLIHEGGTMIKLRAQFIRIVMAAALAGSQATSAQAPGDALERGFQDPPASARPRVWWHWMNGNVTKDGITADFEWMKRVGIGGVQNFDAALATPQVVEKRLVFMTPEWKDAFAHAVSLADTLGLEFAIAGSPGWSESGGPWVKPEHAMKKVVWSETRIEGGKPFTGKLAAPPAVAGPFQSAPRYGRAGRAVPAAGAGLLPGRGRRRLRDAGADDLSMAELKPAFSLGGAPARRGGPRGRRLHHRGVGARSARTAGRPRSTSICGHRGPSTACRSALADPSGPVQRRRRRRTRAAGQRGRPAVPARGASCRGADGCRSTR